MADTWQRAPIVFEWFGNYDYLQSRQRSFDAAVDFMLRNHDRPYALRLFLLDSTGQPVLSSDAKVDPRDWLPGEYRLAESLLVPSELAVGECSLALMLVDPAGRRPPFRLAIDAP